jgi:hypothetical protein
MNLSVYVAIAVWMSAAAAACIFLHRRKTILSGFISGVLFLPVAGLPFTGLTSKNLIVCATIFVASFVGAPSRWLQFRPKLVDVPMLVFCVWPFFSSMENGLGWYDATSAVLESSIAFGMPYLVGRIYFADGSGIELLAGGIVLGALAYVPFCLWEARFSPQLHRLVYGVHQHSFAQTIRFGGFRPVVFMDHGLMVGMWMSAGSLLAVWLWRSGAVSHFLGVPAWSIAAMLCATSLICKSFGALVLLGIGVIVLLLARQTRSAIPLVCLVLVVPLYLGSRISGVWSGEELATISAQIGNAERGESLRFRLHNEDLLVRRAMERPVAGWGRWGRFLVRDDAGSAITVPDGFWIIALGQTGLVGLIAFVCVLLLPVARLARRTPARLWAEGRLAAAGGIAALLSLYMIDSILNGMINPVFFLAAGAVTDPAPSANRLAPVLPPADRPHRPQSRMNPRPARLLRLRTTRASPQRSP